MLESARRHGIAVERLSPSEVTARFPGFAPTEDLVGLYQAIAGFLDPEACVAAHLDLAVRRGAEVHHEEPARAFASDGAGVLVTTDAAQYRAGRLVIAAIR